MINVGIAQIPNSPDIQKNYSAIASLLNRFEKTDADLVVFPECSLSGFTSRMKDSSESTLFPYLELIQSWVTKTGIEVVLPTAISENEKVFNSGFWIKPTSRQKFYKTGLTESERKFFSIPQEPTSKVFSMKGYSFGLLVCFEAEHSPWSFFEKNQVDAILWPAYWGWSVDEIWGPHKGSQKVNPIFNNMAAWKIPLLQANFSMNDLGGSTGAGPEGLSFIIDADNQLVHRGPHLRSDGFLVKLLKDDQGTRILGISDLV